MPFVKQKATKWFLRWYIWRLAFQIWFHVDMKCTFGLCFPPQSTFLHIPLFLNCNLKAAKIEHCIIWWNVSTGPQAIRKGLRLLRRAGPSPYSHVMCSVFLCQKTICRFQNKVVNLSTMSSSKIADRAIYYSWTYLVFCINISEDHAIIEAPLIMNSVWL